MPRRLSVLLYALIVVGLVAALHVQSLAQSQTWPQRPVRIIVPYAAGGNSDGMARIVAQRLTETFGQQFIVENRLGANGAIASEAVARAPADGYTLLWGATPPITIAPAMTKVSYDPVKDFAPISAVGINAFVLLVNKDLPVKSVAEFVAYVRAQPNKLAYAEGSAGSLTHLSMARQRAGADRCHRGPPADHVLQCIRRAAARGERRGPVARGIEPQARTATPRRADDRRIRLCRIRRADLERPDGACGNAQADRRSSRR
jgi:hypothetical protein